MGIVVECGVLVLPQHYALVGSSCDRSFLQQSGTALDSLSLLPEHVRFSLILVLLLV